MPRNTELKTRWFTFGQIHKHNIDGEFFDKGSVIEITAPDPRAIMFALFGAEWSHEYEDYEGIKEWYKGEPYKITVPNGQRAS